MMPDRSEEWRPVVGYEGIYSVSNLGEVRRESSSAGGYSGRILKQFLAGRGYAAVCLNRFGVGKTTCVHILVATSFLGERPIGKQINHKNGIKTDSRLENLEWVTPAENTMHAYRVLGKGKRRISRRGVKHVAATRIGVSHDQFLDQIACRGVLPTRLRASVSVFAR